MKRCFILFSIIVTGLLFIFATGGNKQMQDFPSTPTTAVKPDLNFGKFPLYFIVNKGQVNKKAAFYAKASRYTLWLTKQGLVFDAYSAESIAHSEKLKAHRRPLHSPHSPYSPKTIRDVSRLIFVNANKNPEMVSIKETKLRVNYFIGNDKSRWHGDIPTSQAVLYKNLYKNIDLKIYGIEKQIEYDWIVKPGGSPENIRFEYKNVKGTRLDEEGNLLIETEFGEWIHRRPVSCQEMSTEEKEERKDVDVQFKKIAKNTYGFDIGEYDKRFDLIIDPVVLVYSTYLGGGNGDYGVGIAVDSSGYVYMSGYTYSSDFPTLNQYQLDQPNHDAIVTKLDTAQSGATSLLYSTYLGGGNLDHGLGIVVDDSGYVYVTGETYSPDFPTLNQYQTHQSSNDAFVTKLDMTQGGASSLIYSTCLGGNLGDIGRGIAVDSSGYLVVTGETTSTNFPTLNQYQTDQPNGDVFVAKLDPTQSGASSLIYSTYLGGGDYDRSFGIAVDNMGYAYVTGDTYSSNFPTLNQYQTVQSAHDTFVAKLDPTQSGVSSLIYSTYLGGNGDEVGWGIAVDSSGYTYVTGETSSTNFPNLNQYQTHQSGNDAFVTKLDMTQGGVSSLIYSTYLGGGSYDYGKGIAVDSNECVYVSGVTNSGDFPTLRPYRSAPSSYDAFVTKLDTTQSGVSSLIYSTYLGGGGLDFGRGIAVDNNGYAYVTGNTSSSDFPTLNQYQTNRPGCDAFVTKLILPTITVLSPNGGENWNSGSTVNITWDTQGVSGDLKIYLWKDGALKGTIAKNIDPTSGSYLWTVGQYQGGTASPGTGYTIKIKEMGVHLSDFSDATFNITGAGITVTSPNGGESWHIRSTRDISWIAQGVSNDLRIFLYKDGVLMGTIARNVNPASGSYAWAVGVYEMGFVPPGSGYTIKIEEIGTMIGDSSDSPFTLTN